MKSTTKSKTRSAKSGRFTVERKGDVLYINGNRILDPIGKPSVQSDKLRNAVQEIASRK